MSETVLVAFLSLVGTLMGSLGGIVATGKLTSYRLQQLEDKVNRHNSVIERTYRLEERMCAAEEKLHEMKEHAEKEHRQ